MYFYRDDSDPAPPAPTRPEDDPAVYWYDLLAEDPVPEHHESRGPFEPLQPSNGPPAAASSPAPAGDGGPDGQEHQRARKLEQLRDLYMTAEAIGEQNVDKHFNELLAQQRQLISEYFGHGGPAEAQPPGGDVTPPEGVAVRAEPPRGW